MADVLLPMWLRNAQSRIRYIDSTAVSRGMYTGYALSTALGGDRIGASIEFTPTVSGSDAISRSGLMAFLAQLRGKQNRAIFNDRSYKQQGSFPTSDVITNGSFLNGAASWTAGAQNSINVANRVLCAIRTSVSAVSLSIQTSAAVTVVSGFPYALRAFIQQGRGASYLGTGLRFRIGTSLGDTSLFTGTTTTSFGMLTDVYTTVGTSIFPAIEDRNTSGIIAGDFFYIPFVSVSRCFLVNGAVASGVSALVVDGLPTSTNGLLLPGDQFNIQTSRGPELKIVRNALNSDSGGNGYLQFDPPIRAAVADNSPVIVNTPMSRFIFAGDFPEWANAPGVITTASADFEEA